MGSESSHKQGEVFLMVLDLSCTKSGYSLRQKYFKSSVRTKVKGIILPSCKRLIVQKCFM